MFETAAGEGSLTSSKFLHTAIELDALQRSYRL